MQQKNTFTSWLMALMWLIFGTLLAHAQETLPTGPTLDSPNSTYPYSVSGIIVGILLILVGGLLLFYGYFLLKPILFITGFYVFCKFFFDRKGREGKSDAPNFHTIDRN
jgi:hypothetical protein